LIIWNVVLPPPRQSNVAHQLVDKRLVYTFRAIAVRHQKDAGAEGLDTQGIVARAVVMTILEERVSVRCIEHSPADPTGPQQLLHEL